MIMTPRWMGKESFAQPLPNAMQARHQVENPRCAHKNRQYGVPTSQPRFQGIQMADLPRLNQVIKAFESGQQAFTTFSPADIEPAVALSQSKFDGVVFEMEHNFWDPRALRDALQYMLNRRQIATGGSLAPAVTPMVRIPPNGGEMDQGLRHERRATGLSRGLWAR